MTRFKKGSKVEVLDQREIPSGSWRSAQIVLGNGHTYHVQYDGYFPIVGGTVERVQRKVIRPCPPVVKSRMSWVLGDVIEVFENGSWKVAQISRIVGGGYFFVRPIGSSRQFRAHGSDIRLRQSWKDNKWVIVGQDCGNFANKKMPRPSDESNCFLEGSQQRIELNQCVGCRDACFEEPSHGCLKRRIGACHVGGRRNKAARQEQHDQETAVLASRFLQKVDAVVSPLTMMGENHMHASFDNRTELSDCAESISSSVGSCSTSGSPYRLPHNLVNQHGSDGMDSYSNDAHSYYGSVEESSLARREASAKDIHELELHAYRTTMAALYASGPISWEQEALLTNLRLTLHISNDEHLWEIKHLVSSETRSLR